MMRLPAGVVVLRGEAIDKVGDIFAQFLFKRLRTYKIEDWSRTIEEIVVDLPDNVVRKAAFTSNGATVILDPDLVMIEDTAKWPEVAAKLGLDVLTIESVAEYLAGFFYFNPDYRRGLQVFRGTKTIDDGAPLDEEAGLTNAGRKRFLSPRLRFEEDQVLTLMERFGVPLSDLQSARSFEIWELDASALPMPEDDEEDDDEG